MSLLLPDRVLLIKSRPEEDGDGREERREKREERRREPVEKLRFSSFHALPAGSLSFAGPKESDQRKGPGVAYPRGVARPRI
jgi:hypothetical protein